jgi:hypothetical protein
MTLAPARVIVLGSQWRARDSELAFVTRSVAGALSRQGPVTVATSAPAGTTEPDGAFDLVGIGSGRDGRWPDPEVVRWESPPDPRSIWVLDEATDDARALVDAFGGAIAFSVASASGNAGDSVRTIPFTRKSMASGPEQPIGVHVPVNPLAGASRHTGFGFTGYLLVLTDRLGMPPASPPAGAVAWLTARFYDSYVVVVEGGRAAAWRGRALRGVVPVDSRTDLWRLLAHARVTIDLAPGPVVGRECIESLRLGTPIVVPEQSAAGAHAHAGGGKTFVNDADLLDAVGSLADERVASEFGARGRRYADAYFGDAEGFVGRVDRALRAD